MDKQSLQSFGTGWLERSNYDKLVEDYFRKAKYMEETVNIYRRWADLREDGANQSLERRRIEEAVGLKSSAMYLETLRQLVSEIDLPPVPLFDDNYIHEEAAWLKLPIAVRQEMEAKIIAANKEP